MHACMLMEFKKSSHVFFFFVRRFVPNLLTAIKPPCPANGTLNPNLFNDVFVSNRGHNRKNSFRDRFRNVAGVALARCPCVVFTRGCASNWLVHETHQWQYFLFPWKKRSTSSDFGATLDGKCTPSTNLDANCPHIKSLVLIGALPLAKIHQEAQQNIKIYQQPHGHLEGSSHVL